MRATALLLVSLAFPSARHASGPTGQAATRTLEGAPLQSRPGIAGPARVRDNGDPAIAVFLRDAQERSATFRRLVDTIDATDGIVYVEQGKRCGAGVRACLLLSVTVAGPSRILRIQVAVDRDAAEVMASIGHELQHAVEALSERGVTTGVLLFQFFDRKVGSLSARHNWSFETEAALKAGDAVRAEIKRSERRLASHPGAPSGNEP